MNVTEPIDGLQLNDDLARNYEIDAGTSYNYTLEGDIKGKL